MSERKVKRYLFEYEYEGATYGLTILAYSEWEAVRRATEFARTFEYKGEILASFSTKATWLDRLISWWRGAA